MLLDRDVKSLAAFQYPLGGKLIEQGSDRALDCVL
jgi:hypothetical protein